jgi:hypothetical protein
LIIDDFIPITPKIVEKKQSVLSEEFVSQDYTNPDLIPFRVNEKWGFCDKNRNIKIPLIFDDARPYSEGIAAIRVNDLWGFIDTEGMKICDCNFNNVKDFKNGYAAVQSGWKYGLRNHPKNLKDDWGIINRSGVIIIETEYRTIGEYSSGLFNFSETPLNKGYLDKKNKIVIDSLYSEAEPFSDGIACIKNRRSPYIKNLIQYDKNKPENICFFINNNNEVLFDRGFKSLSSFSNGYAPVECNGNFGLIDIYGQYVIKPIYMNISEKFNQGCIAVGKKILTGQFEGEYEYKWGFVDINNNIVIPFKYDKAEYFNNGRARVWNNENEKYGYINLEGKLVINYIFNYGYSFKNCLAQIRIGDQKGYIDVKGNQYWEN